MRKLKVGLLILYPLRLEDPGSIPGGVWAVGYNLGRLLARFDDLDLHVVHCQPGLAEDRVVQGTGLTVHYLAIERRFWRPAIQGSVGRMIAYLRDLQPDVANAHAAQYAYAGVRAGVPTIYTVHGVVRQEFRVFRRWSERLKFLLPIYYDTVATRLVRDWVAISPYVVRQYRKRTNAEFHAIEVPISPEFFEFREPSPTTAHVLFTAGNLNERKDYLTMLRALAVLRRTVPDVELRIAGTGDPQYRKLLDKFIAEAELEHNVRFVGVLNRPQMVQAYQDCAVVWLSSRQETAPGIICEGMAVGRPVVATDVGGVADMVADGLTGFVVPVSDAQALAERTTRLLQDVRLRGEMGATGRKTARARWWPEQVAQAYHDLYWDVARRSGRVLAQ